MARYSMFGMAGIGVAAATGFVFMLTSLSSTASVAPGINPIENNFGPSIFEKNSSSSNETTATTNIPLALTSTQTLKKFSSINELKNFLLNIELNRGQLSYSLAGPALAFERSMSTVREGAGVAGLSPSAPSFDMLKSPSPSQPQSQAQSQSSESGQSAPPEAAPQMASSTDPALSYSTTNIQVQGVDEPDFLKNDGKYVYILSGDRLTIADVWPPESASIAIKVALDIQQGQYLQNMFLNNNTLVIFYQEYGEEYIIQEYDFAPRPISLPKTHALVLDVSDRQNPKIVNDYEITGSYNNARMIGDRIYLVTTSDLYDYRHPVIPKVAESSQTIVEPEIYYFDNPELFYSFNTVTSIDIAAAAAAETDPAAQDAVVDSKTFMMNPASTLYVSQDNIYIAYQKNLPYNYYYETHNKDRFFTAVVPLLPQDVQEKIKSIDIDTSLTPSQKWDRVSGLLQDTYNRMSEAEKNALFERIQKALSEYDAKIQKDLQRTVIHKIAIGGPDGVISYSAKGEVPGRLLNQFSMDENGNRFRVATTSEYWSPYSSGMSNNIYVLDENMQILGKLEGLAQGESIYAARFMADRLYLITFERIDPFFVIDLSTDQPKVLGELKLPGYSNYLHPYDDNHIIGIGKETKENQYGGMEILGVKLALFDVSDVSNPQAIDIYEIGGPGTDSEVLFDHKALLFDRNKNLLSIPVSIMPDYSQPSYTEDGQYIEPKVWRGFYVFSVDPQSGFSLKGRVEHFNGTDDDYYYSYGVQGSRSFYIENILYTVTLNNLIKMNSLNDLTEINKLSLESTGGIIKYPTPQTSQQAEGQESLTTTK